MSQLKAKDKGVNCEVKIEKLINGLSEKFDYEGLEIAEYISLSQEIRELVNILNYYRG